jgi:hypothetical protein
MSNPGSASPYLSPMRVLTIVSICLCCMVVGFLSECHGHTACSAAVEMADHTSHFDHDHDESEHSFLLPNQLNLHWSGTFVNMALVLVLGSPTLYASPQFPPPKFATIN